MTQTEIIMKTTKPRFSQLEIDDETRVYVDYEPLRASVTIDVATAALKFEESREAALKIGSDRGLKTVVILSSNDSGTCPTSYNGRIEQVGDLLDWYLELPSGTTYGKIRTHVVHAAIGRTTDVLEEAMI